MDLYEVFRNPAMLHSAAVHSPIVLGVLGLPLLLALLVFPSRPWLRALGILVYASMAVTAFGAAYTGKHAREIVPQTLPKEVWDILDRHEYTGELLGWFGLAVALLLAISYIPHQVTRQAISLIALVTGVITVMLVTVTAHNGGTLVYTYGIGTALIHREVQPPFPTPEVDGGKLAPPAAIDPYGASNTPTLAAAAPAPPARQVSFRSEIWPILQEKCVDCHLPGDAEGDYLVTSVADLMKAGKKSGPGVVPFQPGESSVMKYITGEFQPQMPRDEDPLSEAEIALFHDWIAAGATDDGTGELKY